jgi:hypothetical protein
MLLELGKFGSLLLSILCLIAVFHTAFLMPASGFEERIFASLEVFALAAGACLGSGWIFCRWDREVGIRNATVLTSFPMKVFWWASGTMLLLFIAAWYLETHFLPWKTILWW